MYIGLTAYLLKAAACCSEDWAWWKHCNWTNTLKLQANELKDAEKLCRAEIDCDDQWQMPDCWSQQASPFMAGTVIWPIITKN